MLIDLPAVRRALQFVPENLSVVLAGAGLYAFIFSLQSYYTALAGAGDLGAAPLAIGFAVLAFFGFVLAMASWGRAALDKESVGILGLKIGADEGRLAWAAFLIVILSVTVLGTAFLAVAFMIAALALINVDTEAPPPEAGQVDLFGLFGTGEWIVTIVIFGVFALFSLWFFLRLAMAYPATLDAGRIQIMTIWPLSGKGRAVRILSTVVSAAVPGIVILCALNALCLAVTGVYPAASQSASGPDGSLLVSPAVFLLMSFLYGLGKAALIGAPVCAALCALYKELRTRPSTANF